MYEDNNYYQEDPQKPVIINQMEDYNSKKSNGMSIASLVLGITSIILCCACGFPVILGTVGLIFGIISLVQNRQDSGMAVAGIITSTIGIILGIVVVILYFAMEV